MKVYVACNIDWENFEVVAVCDNKELAEKLIDANLASEFFEFNVNEIPHADKVLGGYGLYRVSMQKDGGYDVSPAGIYDKESVNWYGLESKKFMAAVVWALDASDAVQIINKKREEYLADGTWGKTV